MLLFLFSCKTYFAFLFQCVEPASTNSLLPIRLCLWEVMFGVVLRLIATHYTNNAIYGNHVTVSALYHMYSEAVTDE